MEQQALTEQMRLSSSDISDEGDADSVESALSTLDGVRSVKVDPDSHTVLVTYDPTIVDRNLVRERLESAGFSVGDTE